MNESNFASLGPTLLARKGGAKPAMRPQVSPIPGASGNGVSSLDDLGWNDMGEDAETQHDSKVLQLTPEPANPEAAAEATALAAEADAALTNVPAKKPEVLRQRETIAKQIEAPQAKPAPAAVKAATSPEVPVEAPIQAAAPKRRRRSALARGKRAAFTLRLDADRHLKLRLACTLRNHSAQQIVTEALDQFLGTMPDVESLARQAKTSD